MQGLPAPPPKAPMQVQKLARSLAVLGLLALGATGCAPGPHGSANRASGSSEATRLATNEASLGLPSGATPKPRSSVERFGKLFARSSADGSVLAATQKKELLALFQKHILPEPSTLGAILDRPRDLRWAVSFHDYDHEGGDFFWAQLLDRDDASGAALAWLHIHYRSDLDARASRGYGATQFDGFPALGSPRTHRWVLAGNVELRAVAASSAFERDERVDELLRSFDLAALAKL